MLPSSKTPNPEDFRYTSARVKVLETRLLSETDFLRFRNLAPGARVSAMQDTFGWFDGVASNFRNQANAHLYDVAMRLASECNAPDLAAYFLLPKGFEQAQAVLEGAPCPKVLVPQFSMYCSTGSISDLPTEAQDCFEKASRLHDLGLVGSARRLITSTLISLMKQSRFTKLPYFSKLLTHWIDTLDVRLLISSMLRVGTYKGLKGGSLNLRSDTDLSQIARKLGIRDADPFSIEKKLDDMLFESVVESRKMPYGPEVVFGYLWELEREFRNASMLVVGAEVAIPPEELERAYRSAYAN